MVLDSPLLSADDDIGEVRAQTRRVLWDGVIPGTADLAAKVRRLVADGILSPTDVQLVADMYGVAGPEVLRRQLDLLVAGHDWLWAAVGLGSRKLLDRKTPYHNEPDLVERIALPRAQLRRSARRRPARPRGPVARECHRPC